MKLREVNGKTGEMIFDSCEERVESGEIVRVHDDEHQSSSAVDASTSSASGFYPRGEAPKLSSRKPAKESSPAQVMNFPEPQHPVDLPPANFLVPIATDSVQPSNLLEESSRSLCRVDSCCMICWQVEQGQKVATEQGLLRLCQSRTNQSPRTLPFILLLNQS